MADDALADAVGQAVAAAPTIEPSAEAVAFARENREFYLAHRRMGFTQDQATSLLTYRVVLDYTRHHPDQKDGD